MIRFDGRRRKLGRDGDDFRDFVADFLRVAKGYGEPNQRDSGSVDGAIDLYSDSEELVVECKHIGEADEEDESTRAEQEWKLVQGKLDGAFASDGDRARPSRSPYAPWADSRRPIRRYVFVTSARMANEGRRRAFAATIQNFFRDDAAKRPGYGHLKDLAVEIIDWTNIWTALADHPALVFKWLREWPSGFSELDSRIPLGFRAFQHSAYLPYLSRDDWKPSDGSVHPWTEAGLVNDLSDEGGSDPVLVLFGHGGVGKTRLALEIARRMRNGGWWTVHCDGLRATTAGLRQLLGESSRGSRILLFVDYLETWPGFEAFANDLVDLNQSSGHQIRLIATCRTSYRDRLPPTVRRKQIGGGAKSEAEYSKAVTRHILSSMDDADTEVLAEKCRYNFALAAFLLYLRNERGAAFAKELAALREEASFEGWIVKRLRTAGLRDLAPVAAILAACEFSVSVFDDLARAHGADAAELLRVLVGDRWIERRDPAMAGTGEPIWSVFHDIFADVVLGRSLEAASDRSDAIDRLFEISASQGVFLQTFTSFGRLGQTAAVAHVDWPARLLELERRRPLTLGSFARALLATALLTPDMRLELIARCGSLRDAVASDPACALGLAQLVNALSTAKSISADRKQRIDDVLLPLLDVAVLRERLSNIVIRVAFLAAPTRYRDVALQSIRRFPRAFQTHFLLKTWLDQYTDQLRNGETAAWENIEAVRESIGDWLATFPLSAHAGFVFASTLDAAAVVGGERAIELVGNLGTGVKRWLLDGTRAIDASTEFVYKSWLDAAAAIKGELAADMVSDVERHIFAWLRHNSQCDTTEAGFIYASWLSAAAAIGGERAAGMVTRMERFIGDWLTCEGRIEEERPRFVFKSWFDAASSIGGERCADMIDAIETDLSTWLGRDNRGITEVTSYVFVAWLAATAMVKSERVAYIAAQVQARVVSWMDHGDNCSGEQARYVYGSWLSVALATHGDARDVTIALIDRYAERWLGPVGVAESDQAGLFYKSWLYVAVAVGGPQAARMTGWVGRYIARWLKSGDNATNEETHFVYTSWLEAAAAGKLRRFYDETLNWITTHQDSEHCDFVLESWLDKRLEFEPVAEACYCSVRRLYQSPEGTFILKHVVRRESLPADVIYMAWCWCARFPGHEDAPSRLCSLLRAGHHIGATQEVRVIAWVLRHQQIDALVLDPYTLVAARSIIGSLLDMHASPTAEKLGRIYLVRWLRDGRVFCPGRPTHRREKFHTFDQNLSLVESLITLMTHGEFRPLQDPDDRIILEKFCHWIGEWEMHSVDDALAIAGLPSLAEEMADRFGQEDIWNRMVS